MAVIFPGKYYLSEILHATMSFNDPDIISAKPASLAGQVELIAENIYKNKEEAGPPGLLGGKAGITLLYAYLSKLFPGKNYLDITLEYLDELGEALSNIPLSENMSGGVAGIAFVFQHLRNIGILDKSEDLNLSELDEFTALAVENDFQTGNWDPLHGMIGSGIYFLERNKETGEKKYLEKIVGRLANMRTIKDGHLVWITPGYGQYSDDNYNFGMAHGMPGILSFLALVHGRQIRQAEIEAMISSCISFLMHYEYKDDPLQSFPSSMDVEPKGREAKQGSRLAWCYGDLCMAIALIHCGKALQNENLTTKGIGVALKTTHRSFENSGCTDAPFCHGSVGLIHQYNRLFQLTNNEAFKIAAENWLNITLQNFYKPGEGAGGYYFHSFNEEKNIFELIPQYGLLEGSAGIALVYLSYISGIKPNWDIIFLTNV